jgi:hypothetical protein
MSDITIREILSDAIRFWERARPLYNAVLATIVLAFFLAGLPQSKEALSLDWFLKIFMMAVMANFLYCAAYIPDVCVQLSDLREKWLRLRWGLFIVGLGFAAVWTRFISQEGLFKVGN